MKIVLSFFFLLSLSCERHQMHSEVIEVQLLKRQNLNAKENLQKAFLEKDYQLLQSSFDLNTDIETTFSDGRTLLFMAIEGVDFKMVDFLLFNKANPNNKREISGEEYTAIDYTQIIADEVLRMAMIQLLEGKLENVSELLFFRHLQAISSGKYYDLEWLKRLYIAGIDFKRLKEADFTSNFFKKALIAKNFVQVYSLLFTHRDELPLDEWVLWVEKVFAKGGTYSKAKCQFINYKQCFRFEEAMDTCLPNFRTKLDRSRNYIEPYLIFRNMIFNCH